MVVDGNIDTVYVEDSSQYLLDVLVRLTNHSVVYVGSFAPGQPQSG